MVHCSAQTLSTHVIHKLSQACTMSQTQHGRMYRPKDASRLVLYLKDINLPKPDKYETAELAAFLQQLVTYQVCTEGVCGERVPLRTCLRTSLRAPLHASTHACRRVPRPHAFLIWTGDGRLPLWRE